MNNNINVTKHDLSQTNGSAISASVNSMIKGVAPAGTADSTNQSDSFLNTFLQVSDQLVSDSEATTEKLTGNNLPDDLPLTRFSAELSAENDHGMNGDGLNEHDLDVFSEEPLGVSIEADSIITPELLVVDNDDLGFSSNTLDSNTMVMANENKALNDAVDIARNSASSLMSSLSNIQPTTSLSQPTEVTYPKSKNSPANTLTSVLSGDLNRTDLSQTLKVNPEPVSITPSVAPSSGPLISQETISPLSETMIQPSADRTKSLVTNVAESQIAEGISKDTVSSNILNNLKETGNEILKSQLSPSKSVQNLISKIEGENAIHPEIATKPTIDREISALQNDLDSVDDVLLNTKQNLYSKKPVSGAEPQLAQAGSVTRYLSSAQLYNQEVVEISKTDAAVLTSTSVTNQSETHLSTSVPANVLSPQLRATLQSRPINKAQALDNVSVTSSSNSTVIDKNLMQSMDAFSLATESSGIISDKIQKFANTLSQHQSVATAQVSQLATIVQTTENRVDVDIDSDSLLGITNPATTSITNVNSFTLPKAEITEFFGKSAWPQAMGKQVLSMINQNIGSAEIRLNPAHLGPIEILIDMSEDQVNVSLSSRHAVVREAMEQALPRLKEMLDENGFNLADTDISQHSFAEQREQKAKENNHITETGDTARDQLSQAEITDSRLHRRTEFTSAVDYFV